MTRLRWPAWPRARASGGDDRTPRPEPLSGHSGEAATGAARPLIPRPPDRAATKLAYLSEMELFQDFTSAEMDEVARMAAMVTCERGRVFYLPEETGEVLFVLKKGRVALYRLSPEGRKLVLATLGPGTVFGEMSLVGQGMYDAFAEAIEGCTLCVLSRADVERLLLRKPPMSLRLMAQMGRRLQEAERQLEDLAFKGLAERLAGLLLRLAQQGGTPGEVAGYSHQDLADMLGVYRESVTTTLDVLKAEGAVAIERRRIRLLDVERLRALAGAEQ